MFSVGCFCEGLVQNSMFDFESAGANVWHPFMLVEFVFGSYYLSLFSLVCLVFSRGWVRTYFFRKQFLLSLLRLEFLVLSLFLGFVGLVGSIGGFVSITFYLLVMGACEATLGLSLLVGFVRLLGSDILSKVRLVKC